MNKKILLCCFALFTATTSIQAQSFLKKALNAAEKVTKQVDKALGTPTKTQENSTSGETTSSTTQSTASDNAPKGRKSNFYGLEQEAVYNKFGSHKQTADTKVIMVDDLSSIKLGLFYDNRAIVTTEKNGTFCIDEQGNIVKHWKHNDDTRMVHFNMQYPKFDSGRIIDLVNSSNSLTGKEAIVYDKNFNVIKKIPNVQAVSDYEDGIASIIVREKVGNGTQDKCAYIDISGNIVFKNITDLESKDRLFSDAREVRPLRDGLAAFCIYDKTTYEERWGFRDANGKVIIPATYYAVQDFSDGVAAVCTGEQNNKKWGYVDTKGNMVIAPQYSIEPSNFDDCGMAMILNKEGTAMFINKEGAIVCTQEDKGYEAVTPFCNGKAICLINSHYFCLIDHNFNIVTVLSEEWFWGGVHKLDPYLSTGMKYFDNRRSCDLYSNAGTVFRNNQIYPIGWGSYSLLSETGDIVVSGLSGTFINGLAPVNINPHDKEDKGYVNMKGEWVIKFEESKF